MSLKTALYSLTLPVLLSVFLSPKAMSQTATTPNRKLETAEASDSKRHFDNIRVPMRDGIFLSTNVFLPEGSGPFPTILIRTPYDAGLTKNANEWTDKGFAVVYQDVRGRFRSEGEDIPWISEKEDAEDTLNWMTKEPWCNGNVGMYGGSYLGYTQVAAVRTGHPALKVVTPTLIGADRYYTSYWGGALRHGLTGWYLRKGGKDLEKHVPLSTLDQFVSGKEIPYWHEVLAHPTYDDFWKKQSIHADFEKIQAPAFIRTGWFDLFLADAFDLFNGIRNHAGSALARQQTRMIVGPWPHEINKTDFCDADFGANAKISDLFEQEVAYMSHFLRGDPKDSAAPLRLFVMGINEWRDEYEWPLARTKWTKFYLSGNGQANSAAGDGRLADKPSGADDHYDYDPANPTPTSGGAWGFNNVGLKNQEEIEKRRDVLVYTSDPLKEAVEVTGTVKARLSISSSAPDTDFTVKLVDVAPDGQTLGVTDGIVRARYRNQVPEGELLKPGEIYQVNVTCIPTSYVFKAGHRMRVQVSSSNFPMFARNLNTGEAIAEEKTPIIAKQTIHHSEEHPSYLELPIIPQRSEPLPKP